LTPCNRLRSGAETAGSEHSPPWRSYGNLRHKLADILVIGLYTIMCKSEDFTDMENFGNERENWLKIFIERPNRIPSSDTFRQVFERINLAELSNTLYAWPGMLESFRLRVESDI
jgi:hypothetical protein